MKTSQLFLSILFLFSCTMGNLQPLPGEKTPQQETCEFYLFDGKYYDLKSLKEATTKPTPPTEFKNSMDYRLRYEQRLSDTLNIEKTVFTVNKNYDLVITKDGKKLKAVPLPVERPLPEVHEYYFNLMAHADGLIVIMEDYYGTQYTVLKYDQSGKELARTSFEHTFVTHPEPKTNHHHRYLYLSHTTVGQLVFSSHEVFGEKDKTILLNLSDFSTRNYDFKISGILLNERNESVVAFVQRDKDNFTVKFVDAGKKDVHFTIAHADNTCETIVINNKLVVANYHSIATGSSLQCFDLETGKQLWKASVLQVNASHSEYYNTVLLNVFENKIIMEGIESYGKYLQVFDPDSGERLACFGIPEFMNPDGDK